MQRMTWTGALLLGWVAVAAPAAAEVSVTVYNQNLGLITEHRALQLEAGIQTVSMQDVAALLDPTSVRVSFPGRQVEIYEQNYRYDLVNTGAILQKYIDRQVRLVGKEGRVYEGILLSVSGGMYVVQTRDGLQLIDSGELVTVDLEELPQGFYTRPTLEWQVSTARGGKTDAQISYLTGGLSWHAEYVAHLHEDDRQLDLSGWASIDNESGATYRDAKLKLIAGDIHRATQPTPRPMQRQAVDMALAAPEVGFQERAFFEYHLYDLPRRTTLANKEVKQIALFEPATANVVKKYKYRPYRDAQKVAVVVEFENSAEEGLGMPLPAGVVRITKSDVDGTEQLLGEDRIDHTPRDEEVSLNVGNAFDLSPEFRTIARREISRRVSEEDALIKLRNHKEQSVEIEVEQKAPRYAGWRITDASHEFEKVDADTFRFHVTVPQDGEVELTYTLRVER